MKIGVWDVTNAKILYITDIVVCRPDARVSSLIELKTNTSKCIRLDQIEDILNNYNCLQFN